MTAAFLVGLVLGAHLGAIVMACLAANAADDGP